MATATLNNASLLHGATEKFQRACRNGNCELAKSLFGEFPQVINSRAAFGHTAVHIASERGHVHILQWLRDNGADFSVKTRPRKQTAAHFAAEHGRVDTIRWLVVHAQPLGCDLNAQDYRGRTAADLARQYGSTQAAACLEAAKRIETQTVKDYFEKETPEEQGLEEIYLLKKLLAEEILKREDLEARMSLEITMLKEQISRLQISVKTLNNEDVANHDIDESKITGTFESSTAALHCAEKKWETSLEINTERDENDDEPRSNEIAILSNSNTNTEHKEKESDHELDQNQDAENDANDSDLSDDNDNNNSQRK